MSVVETLPVTPIAAPVLGAYGYYG